MTQAAASCILKPQTKGISGKDKMMVCMRKSRKKDEAVLQISGDIGDLTVDRRIFFVLALQPVDIFAENGKEKLFILLRAVHK